MPPKGGADLSDQDVAAVAAYVWAVGRAANLTGDDVGLGAAIATTDTAIPMRTGTPAGYQGAARRDGEPPARDTQSGRDPIASPTTY